MHVDPTCACLARMYALTHLVRVSICKTLPLPNYNARECQ
jgi:hypothetical protein